MAEYTKYKYNGSQGQLYEFRTQGVPNEMVRGGWANPMTKIFNKVHCYLIKIIKLKLPLD